MGLGDLDGGEREHRAEHGEPVHRPDRDHSPQPAARPELSPAVDEFGDERAARRVVRRGGREPQQEETDTGDQERRRVRRVDRPGARQPDEHARERRARHGHQGLGDPQHRIAALHVRGHARHGRGDARLEERRPHAGHRAQRVHRPQGRVAGGERDREHGGADQPQRIGDDHHPAWGEAVRQDAAEEDEHGQWPHPGRQRVPHGGVRPPGPQQSRGEGHRDHSVTEERGGPGDEEEPEVPVPERVRRHGQRRQGRRIAQCGCVVHGGNAREVY